MFHRMRIECWHIANIMFTACPRVQWFYEPITSLNPQFALYVLLLKRELTMRTVFSMTSKMLINKLQRVQNAASRLVVRRHRWEYITPLLMKLHWLPVKQCVQYLILLLVIRAQHCLRSPYCPYITGLLAQRATRVLCSTLNNDQYLPPSRSR